MDDAVQFDSESSDLNDRLHSLSRSPWFYKIAAILLLTLFIALGAAATERTTGVSQVVPADFYEDARYPEPKIRLGNLLFFDKVLSGNRNIACAPCHHPSHGTSDGVALAIGESGSGLGPDRRVQPEGAVLGRVPRNAPALNFLGAEEFTRLFHDGRVEAAPDGPWTSGFWTPARDQLPDGLDNVLAAQAMFPVTSNVEMAGARGQNPVSTAAALNRLAGPEGVWALLAQRLRGIPEYVVLFQAAFPDVATAEDITFVHAANAIAAFEADAFRPDDSPFDRYLQTGDPSHLSDAAVRGMDLFYGTAGCAGCHSGKFQSDQDFHAIAMPQIGPGKAHGWDRSYWQATGFAERLEDFGRYAVTGRPEDMFRFRTPSLRNVELSGPWGHAGAYATLHAVVRHHSDPLGALETYRLADDALPPLTAIRLTVVEGSRLVQTTVNPRRLDDYTARDAWVQDSPTLRGAIAEANELAPIPLDDGDVDDIVAFLHALTDPRFRDLDHLIPERVPSGLPVAD